MTAAQGILLVAGLLSGMTLIGTLVWSIFLASRRIWPPNNETSPIPTVAWGLTLAVFGTAIGLGILDWGTVSTLDPVRWALGPVLIVAGNLIVWCPISLPVIVTGESDIPELQMGDILALRL